MKTLKDLKIGDQAFRKKEYHGRTEWIEFTVNEEYLQLIKEFPEDYRVGEIEAIPETEESAHGFENKDIEDVRILFQVKGKHYSIIPKKGEDEDECRGFRIELGKMLFVNHDVVLPSLEEIREEKAFHDKADKEDQEKDK